MPVSALLLAPHTQAAPCVRLAAGPPWFHKDAAKTLTPPIRQHQVAQVKVLPAAAAAAAPAAAGGAAAPRRRLRGAGGLLGPTDAHEEAPCPLSGKARRLEASDRWTDRMVVMSAAVGVLTAGYVVLRLDVGTAPGDCEC